MKNFIKNIREHKAAAAICLLLLAALITAAVLAMKNETNDDSSSAEGDGQASGQAESSTTVYFKGTDYPVTVTRESNGTLTVEFDGSKSPDSAWGFSTDDTESALVEVKNSEEKDCKMTSTVAPVSMGYAALSFTRSGEVSGIKYNAVTIEAEVCVSADKDGNMQVSLSDIKQNLSSAGALDSETPYMLKDDKVIMPNGGDWVLEPKLADGAPSSLFRIYRLNDVDGMEYFAVEKVPSALAGVNADAAFKMLAESRLVLKSESLDIEQELECTMTDDRTWKLSVYNADEKTEDSSENE